MVRFVSITAAVAALVLPAFAFGAVVSRSVLKSYFQTGDQPTQSQFSVTSPDGEVSPLDPPDFIFRRGIGSVHTFEGLANAQMLSDGSGHAILLGEGEVLRPTSGQFSSFIDSSLSILDDRRLIGIRFERSDGMHYGFLDVSVDSPLPGWSDFNAFTIHGWAYETVADAPITTFFVPAPGTGFLALGAVAVSFRRRRH